MLVIRVTSKIGSGPFRDRFARKLSNAAAKIIPDRIVAEKMAKKIVSLAPERLSEMGMDVVMHQVFLKEGFIVLKM
jgi:hypothetical protein